ncbi:hypothetical protein N7456_000723 [Penicillium angulare]|uniref:GST N-terminal domain-containing protein n=1 Tax=Penicillium angulare TaxID=116970 RepID=A0A9W9KSD6_9EURO|nr:hypothetical protein N7456_000723 [Penicillium angulare]
MTDSEPVHFFDITSTFPGALKSWSPNTLKVRMALNFKKIPYTQSWVSYPDIAPLIKGLGVEPNATGTKYTLPAIVHKSITSNSNSAMMDSLPIIEHLDKLFPEHPLFPSGEASYSLYLAVNRLSMRLGPAIRSLVIPSVPDHLDPRGQEYFIRTRSEFFGKPLAEVRPTDEGEIAGLLEELQKELKGIITVLKGREGKKGPFFEGETPGYVDLNFVCHLAFFHRFDRGLWEKLVAEGEGELLALWNACLPWLEGQGEEKEWPIPEDV